MEELRREFISFLIRIAFLFTAALVPLVLGDKIAGAIQGKISDWTRGMKKSAYARSRGGASIEARRKIKEATAQQKAFERTARGNILSRRLGETKIGQSLGFLSPNQRKFATLQTSKAMGGLIPRPPEYLTDRGKEEWYRRFFTQLHEVGGSIKNLAAATWNDPNAIRALNDLQTFELVTEGSKQAIRNFNDQTIKNPGLLFNKPNGVGRFIIKPLTALSPEDFDTLEKNALRMGYSQEKIAHHFEQYIRRMNSSEVGSFDEGMFKVGSAAQKYISRYLTPEQLGNITDPNSVLGKGRYRFIQALIESIDKAKGTPYAYVHGNQLREKLINERNRLAIFEQRPQMEEIPGVGELPRGETLPGTPAYEENKRAQEVKDRIKKETQEKQKYRAA